MTTSMTLTKLPFYPVYLVAIAGSLAIFTAIIGGGRLTGPGIALSLSVGALLWVARLLFESARALVAVSSDAERSEALAASGRRRKELEREYYILKRAIKELELDHAMGKISTEDYGEIRTRYRERAVRVLRQLDQGETYRSQIEADLKARRAARGLGVADKAQPTGKAKAEAPASRETEAPAQAEAPSPAVVHQDAAEPAQPSAREPVVAAGACARCATSNDADAVFCKKCGNKLAATAS